MSRHQREVALALATRVGDEDRQRCIEVLSENRAYGALTAEEFEQRVAAAWSGKVRADLDVLLVDLPLQGDKRPARRPDDRRGATRPRLGVLAAGVPIAGVLASVVSGVSWASTGSALTLGVATGSVGAVLGGAAGRRR